MIQVLQIYGKPSISPNSTKTTLLQENRSYQTAGQNNVPWNTSGRTFSLKTVRPLRGFQGKLHFVQL